MLFFNIYIPSSFNRFVLCLCIAATAFPACDRFGKKTELWFYTYRVAGNTAKDSILTPASFLCLQPDGAYTRDFGVFDYGRWTKKDGQLLLTSASDASAAIPIKSEELKEMQLQIGDQTAAFELQPVSFAAGHDNPFSADNNQWRIPAKQKETDQQIKKRLQNHCRFWQYYFRWALNSEFSSVDVRSTPTSIKIYGNGFGLKPYGDLPATWRGYFYDSIDCQRANTLLRGAFEQRAIAWAYTDNKYKMFISAFEQLEQHIK